MFTLSPLCAAKKENKSKNVKLPNATNILALAHWTLPDFAITGNIRK